MNADQNESHSWIIRRVEASTGIADAERAKVSIFPNPSSGLINITSGDSPLKRVEVFDVTGKLVLSQFIENTMRANVDLSGYEKGVYLISVGNTQGHQTISRVVLK
mgnify:CR=1 FL=1